MTLAPGQRVYREGDDATGLVMSLDGLLRLEATVGEHTVLVGVSLAGGAFGQSQRRGGAPRIVTARAGPASRVVTVSDAALERIGADHPTLWQAVSELVYAQLDASVHGLAQMLALPPLSRIAARLMLFADVGVAPLTQATWASSADFRGNRPAPISPRWKPQVRSPALMLRSGWSIVRC